MALVSAAAEGDEERVVRIIRLEMNVPRTGSGMLEFMEIDVQRRNAQLPRFNKARCTHSFPVLSLGRWAAVLTGPTKETWGRGRVSPRGQKEGELPEWVYHTNDWAVNSRTPAYMSPSRMRP